MTPLDMIVMYCHAMTPSDMFDRQCRATKLEREMS